MAEAAFGFLRGGDVDPGDALLKVKISFGGDIEDRGGGGGWAKGVEGGAIGGDGLAIGGGGGECYATMVFVPTGAEEVRFV